MRPAILVLYYARGVAQLPLRGSVADHLWSWSRHSRHPVIYHNYAFGFDWNDFADLPICAVILDTIALNIRWDIDFFRQKSAPLHALQQFHGPKIAMPQDEFIHTDALCEFLAAIEATHVLSAAPPDVAEFIYRPRLPTIRIAQKLTGYIEDTMLRRIEELSAAVPERDIDVGYRAWRAEPWLGTHGQLKVRVAQEALAAAKSLPELRIDVSTDDDAVLLGDDWLKFLLRCRTTLGVEGGASILDRDGAIRARTRSYVADHPDATFDEVRQSCFAADDGSLDLRAIGPRHLEACATRTCQLLVEGEYQGLLRKGVDYIPIARDFSNIADAMRCARDDALTQRIAGNAYDHIVRASRLTYRRFVRATEAATIPVGHLPIRSWFSIADRFRIGRAIARHAEIWDFAQYEARHLLPNRWAYENSEEPHWVAERAKVKAFATRTNIRLALD